jgi:DNA modification methylase
MKQQVKISKVKGNPSNPRIIKNDKFKKLVKSIQEFPEMLKLRPIVVDEDMMVLGGNMRLKASKDAGLKEVWIEVAEGLTEEQKKEFIVKDNVGFGEWEWDMLANEWDSVQLADWGLDVWENLDDKEPEAGLIEDDEIPEVKESKVKRGDIWQLGEHRIMCGDSTSSDDVEKLMNGEKADMVFTDPPYGINLNTDLSSIKTEKNGWKGKGGKYDKIIGDDKEYNPTHIFELFGYCENIFLWGADYYSHFIPNRNEGCFFVWDKVQNANGKGISWNLGSMFELCWSKKKYKREIYRKLWAGLYGTETQDVRKRIHPTQKPIELAIWFIEKEKSKLIIDLFLGSGSTLIAAEKLQRKCYGMELDEKYCDVIIERWEQFTGLKAIKNGTK